MKKFTYYIGIIASILTIIGFIYNFLPDSGQDKIKITQTSTGDNSTNMVLGVGTK